MFLLERFVISRAAALSDDIASIGTSGDFGRPPAGLRQR